MQEAALSTPAEGAGYTRCENCSKIDARKPFCGPRASQTSSGRVTRVCYSHAQNLSKLLESALEQSCHFCYLILDAIRKYHILVSNKKNVLDDWDLVDDIGDFDESGTEEDEDDGKSDSFHKENEQYDQFFRDAATSFDAVNDTASPLVLEFVFRDPRRDELASRCIDVVVHWTQTGGRARLSTSAFYLVAQISDELAELCEARNVREDTSTSSDYSFDLARLWSRKCDAEHDLCRKRKQQRELLLPTRVISVDNAHGRPRLFEPRKGQAADYVCLSHCWGRSQPFTTETKTLAARRSGMDMDAMPKTFQDAITITRELGIQYLWIDSLCIIQDSAEDWARESAQMGKIYRDAAITIFAEHSDSDDGGCFASRPGQASALCRTPMFDDLCSIIRGENSVSTRTFIQAKLHHAGGHSMPERHSIFETIKTLDRRTVPLNLRAWVLQESILSHRALIYDQHEIRWSCPTMKACECIPEGHTRQSWSQFDKGDADAISTRDLTDAWALIVNEFSNRRLTFNKDRLPALAGIASEMQRYKHSKYFAGLWQDDLRLNLSWHVFHRSPGVPYRENRRILDSTAPSWSWAKIEGDIRMRIHYNDLDHHDSENEKNPYTETFKRAQSLICEILSCTTTPLNPLNPFGEVQPGTSTLHLRGPLGQVECCIPVTDIYNIDRIPIRDPHTNRQTGWFDPDVYPVPCENPITQIWCMPLYNNHGNLCCLAMVPAVLEDRIERIDAPSRSAVLQGKGEERVFRRVGMVAPKLVRSDEDVTPLGNNTPTSSTHPTTAAKQNTALLAWFESCGIEDITFI